LLLLLLGLCNGKVSLSKFVYFYFPLSSPTEYNQQGLVSSSARSTAAVFLLLFLTFWSLGLCFIHVQSTGSDMVSHILTIGLNV
jgi:hypothetical protein